MTTGVLLVALLCVFILNALAVHRLIHLVIDDKISEPIRNWIYSKFGQPHLTWTYLFTCPWCVSIWAAAFMVALFFWFPYVWLIFSSILALSSVSTIAYEHEDRH